MSNFSQALSILKDWQTLVGAIIALISAAATVYALNLQLVETRRQYREKEQRNTIAGRAKLPLALMHISNYLSQCMEIFTETDDTERAIGLVADLDRPDEDVEAIQDAIRYVDLNSGEALRFLVQKIQIYHARTRIKKSSLFVQDQIIFDTAELGALIYETYSFAKNDISVLSFKGMDIKQIFDAINQLMSLEKIDHAEEIKARIRETAEATLATKDYP